MKRLGLILSLLAVLLMPAAAGAKSQDRDHDRLPDRWEKKHKLSTKHKSAHQDKDRDGLTNLGEYRSKTNPRRTDTDRDGIQDDDEDRDRDRVDNENEIDEGTSPRDRDSDDDGRSDGREDPDRDGLNNAGEDRTGNDPTDADTDNDGTDDGDEQAGVVTSFENGMLTVDLANGTSVTGLVTDATEIGCETEDSEEADHDDDRPVRRASKDGDDSDDGSGPGDGDRVDEPRDDDDDGDVDGEDADEFHEDGSQCSSADLVPGARVHEAELNATSDGLVFEEVELLR